MAESKNKIIVNGFDDVLKIVDEKFAEVLVLLNQYGILSNEKVKRTFNNQKEFLGLLESLVLDYLNEKYNRLHERLSKLRKKGFELDETSLKLQTFKFKLKVFKANLDKKSFNKVILVLQNVGGELEKIESGK